MHCMPDRRDGEQCARGEQEGPEEADSSIVIESFEESTEQVRDCQQPVLNPISRVHRILE